LGKRKYWQQEEEKKSGVSQYSIKNGVTTDGKEENEK
jgi:hypothetical protein